MENRIKVMVFEPLKEPHIEYIKNSKEVYKNVVEGEYKVQALDKQTVLIHNEKDKELELVPNRNVGRDIICGTFFIARDAGEEMYASLSDDQAKYYYRRYKNAEVISQKDVKENLLYSGKIIGKNEVFINNINLRIGEIDFKKVVESYKSCDYTEAKKLLKMLHEEFCETFGTSNVDKLTDGDDIFIHLPAIMKSKETGEICVGLVYVDTESSGEHWGTTFAFGNGFIAHNDMDKNNPMFVEKEEFGEYDYWYTPDYSGDIHSDKNTAPKEVKEMLEYAKEQKQGVNIYEFKEHSLTLRGEKSDMLDFVNAVRESCMEGTLSDLAYKIEYAFDIDLVRSTNVEDECANDEDYAENNYGISGMDGM